MSIPNILSVFRLLLVPVFVLVILEVLWWKILNVI